MGRQSSKSWVTHTGLAALGEHFKPGSYDIIRKNCNSFSDCCLHYLLGARLCKRYTILERSTGLLERLPQATYIPNQMAATYSTDDVIAKLAELDGSMSRVAEPSPTFENSPCQFSLGEHVTVCGLKHSETMNGKSAEIVCYNRLNNLWKVKLFSTGEVKAFRAENLRRTIEFFLLPPDYGKRECPTTMANALW